MRSRQHPIAAAMQAEVLRFTLVGLCSSFARLVGTGTILCRTAHKASVSQHRTLRRPWKLCTASCYVCPGRQRVLGFVDDSIAVIDAPSVVGPAEHRQPELTACCHSVKPLAHLNDRQALEDDLRAAAVSNPSVLGQLQALASSQEDRWSSEQARQITESLYSGDPVLAREAFFALLGAMDRDSPGGQDRNTALMAALGPIYACAPLSNFDRLDVCASIGRCSSVSDADHPEPALEAAVLRLEQKYRAAVESRMDARSIMAIR